MMNKIMAAAISLAFVSAFAVQGFSQSASPTPDVLQRIADLESKLKAISDELILLKQASSPPAAKTSENTTAGPTVAQKPKETPAETKKKDLGIDVGTARLTPYGTLYFNAFGNSSGTNNADVPIFASASGAGNASASVRQTRLGLKLEGAKVGKARLGAVFEGDFFGGFPSVGTGENFGIFRVRLAYMRLDWEKTSVTAGQDWMVFAPLSPTSLAAAGNPQLAAAGNNWARLPQVRVDRKFGQHVTLQAAVLEQQTGDFAANAAFTVQPNSGNSSKVPFLQSRLAYSAKGWFGVDKQGTIGISAHYGRARVFTGASNIRNNIESTGVALDWNLPLAERVGLTGEAFFGRNLGGFQSGVFQNYNNDFAYRNGSSLIAGGVRAIGTAGGWMQISFTPPILRNKLGIYGSGGVDDPFNKDLVSVSHRDWRTRNVAFAGSGIYKFTPQFSIGVEFRRFVTTYLYSGRKTANHVNLGAAYVF